MEPFQKERVSNKDTFGVSNESYVIELENGKHNPTEDICINSLEIPGSVQKDYSENGDILVQNNVISKRKDTDATDADNVSEVYDISYTFNQYSVVRWIVQSQFVQLLQRFWPLMVSLCYGFDISLDIHQTYIYYELFQNGTNHSDGIGYLCNSNITSISKPSPTYIYATVAAWISVPLLWSIFLLIGTQNPLPMVNRVLKLCLEYEINLSYGFCLKMMIGIFALPIDFIASALWLYIVIPYISLKRALQTAILGTMFDKEDNISHDLPVVGIRALPQLIIATLFIVNHYEVLLFCPVTIISITFSALSLLIGIVIGLIKVREYWQKKASSDLSKVRNKTKQQISKVQEFMDETPQVKLKDKFSFTLGILTICMSQWLATRYPEYFIYFWIPLTICLWINRFVDYSANKFELFMLDFCYFINVSVAIQIIFYPDNLEWFQANYVLTLGPIYFAIIPWRNSLVFHDLDKLTSFFLHTFPPIIMHMYRWGQIKNNLPIKEGDEEEDALSLTGNFAWPLAFYGIWQIIFILLTSVVLHHYLRDKSVVTSYRYLMKGKKRQGIYNLMDKLLIRLKIMKVGEQLDPDTILGKVVFTFIQLVYTVLVIAPVRLLYASYALSMSYLILVFAVACWNGASYYIEIFSKRYNMKFDNKVNAAKEKA